MESVTSVIEPVLLGFAAVSEHGSIGFGAAYLVTRPGRRILFDCGHVGRRRALLRGLSVLDCPVSSVDTLVLSHGHYDHVQNADLFRAADVLLHPAERARLAAAPADDPVQPPWTAALLAGLTVRDAADGEELAPGVEVLALPGHTAGSIGLVVRTAAGTAVLTGDAVPGARAVRNGRPSTAVDPAAGARSVALVRDRADLVYPGHDRPFALTGGEPGDYLLPPAPLPAAPA
jgi:N-acyl homoserine lactone hydrolase